MDKKIKIYISCFNNRILTPDNQMFQLVQAGAANAAQHLPNMSHDDDGENISKKNARFNDTTTQYWAWKNEDNDYYGFYQYRRFLSFNLDILPAKVFEKNYTTNNQAAFEDMKLQDERYMRSIIEQYDVITCNPLDYEEYKYTLYEQFRDAENQHIEDLDKILEIIERKYPEYMEAAEESLFNGKGYFAHCFIMKKKYFFKYCEWMFDILQEYDDNKDYSDYSPMEQRVVGYLSERLLGIYYAYLRMNTDCKFFELQKCFFETTREMPIDPAFSENNIAVLMTTSKKFLPYSNTLVQSIVDNASKNHNYDVVLLHDGITNYAIKRFCDIKHSNNVSIRFVNISSYFAKENFSIRGHFGKETFFRFAMQDVMANYAKVLYLDSDMVVQTDIAQLYDIDINGYALAAIQDPDTAGLYNGFDPLRKSFSDKVLKFKNPYDYFQAGVILFNLKEFGKLTNRKDLIKLAQSRNWDLLDQDVLNVVAHGHVKYLDMAWNVMTDWNGIRVKDIISLAPQELQNQYHKARKAPKIIHYAGPEKPWNNPMVDMQETFWYYAQRCPLYSDIISRHNIKEKYSKYYKQKNEEKPRSLKNIANVVFPKGSKQRVFARKIVGKGFEYSQFSNSDNVIDTLLEDTLIMGCGIEPAFGGNSIPIALTSSNYFSIYMGVTIQSILDNCCDKCNYDILVLHQEISKENQNEIKSMAKNRDNISIRFVNIKFALNNITMDVASQFSKEIFCRPLLHKILDRYDKMIFVDSDMVVNADLKELNDIDLGNNLLAAVKDACFSVFYNHPDPKIIESNSIKKYLDDVVCLKTPQDVFNAGLTVINLAGFRKNFNTAVVLYIANLKNFPYADQDVLNIMCQEKVLFLPHEWNFRVDVLMNNINLRGLTYHYNRLKKDIKVIHYAGGNKPWNTLNLPTEEVFWHYAERSPFYTAIVKRMIWEQVPKISYQMLAMQPTKSRKILEKTLPQGSWMRKIMENTFPLGSKRRNIIKKVINTLFRK